MVDVDHMITNDRAPVITLNNGDDHSVDVPENTKSIVRVTATDADNESLTYSVEANPLFEITSEGELSFKDEFIPDFERPTNSQGVFRPTADQMQTVRVTVMGRLLRDSIRIDVTTIDVPEGLLMPPDQFYSGRCLARRVAL